MKITTNYIIYLNESNKVHCAKCRNTGRFVKRSVAQAEYDIEYNYFNVSVLTMFILFATIYLTNLLESITMNTLSTEQVLSHFKAGRQVVLFTSINTYVFKNTVNSEVEILAALNSGEVNSGRILAK